MANYATLKAAINAVIKANGQREITGTVLNQTLNAMVNSLGANYQLAGVATPSTNPGTPDQNVFYLAFEAGTYTNFNATVLSAGISILMWNGSWSSQTFYTIDATPTASSNNLVSSGAVFDAIKTDGSAYDVSAHFPTGGPNSDGKFTLEYILSNANTLIPVSWRKGGMSIRFISSIDNKYVQYRLMATAWSTTVTDWQGVDDEPTAESANLVKSGGIRSDIDQIKQELNSKVPFNIKGYLNADGTVTYVNNTTHRVSEILKVSPGDRFLYRGKWGASVYFIYSYTDAFGSNPSGLLAGGEDYKNNPAEITIPNGVNYIRAWIPYLAEGEKYGGMTKISSYAYISDKQMENVICKTLSYNLQIQSNASIMLFNDVIKAGTKVKVEILSDTDLALYITRYGDGTRPRLYWGNVTANVLASNTVTVSDDCYSLWLWTTTVSGTANVQVKLYLNIDALDMKVKDINGPNVVTVGDFDGADYSEIQNAINDITDSSASNPYTILVYPKGTPYAPFSMIRSSFSAPYPWDNVTPKHISIIGVDKAHCLIQSDKGDYNYPAAELITNGIIKDLRFLTTNNDHLIGSTEGGYAAHIDTSLANNVGYKMVVENCEFISEMGPGLGIGTTYNVDLKIIGCEIINKGDPTYSPVENYKNIANWGAVFMHSAQNLSASNQKFALIDCILRTTIGTKSLKISPYSSDCVVTLLRNVCWADSQNEVAANLGTGVTYDPMNFGNNFD